MDSLAAPAEIISPAPSPAIPSLLPISPGALIRTEAGRLSEERWNRALEAVGRFGSGRRDGSVHHDKHLAEVFLK